ncbi:glycosyltransferase family 4 protein [Nonlabens dokdonensis]|uniref:glycosyltransferase family 4 protein n=1 Tax=Nonlabens dokdonensis TaxID=328515 RepID=UPI0026ED200E|nr:glycosyltransferase family 4 protein [Nonlabens dokdonensis]
MNIQSKIKLNRKKVLILGPISDFGGREVEVQLISKALIEEYDIDLISTLPFTYKSVALLSSANYSWNSLQGLLYKNSIILRISSLLTKFFNRRKEVPESFINNVLTYQLVDLDKKMKSYLEQAIASCDIVLFCGEFTSKWLIESFEICQKYHKPILVRTTGQIKKIPESLFENLHIQHHILVHSVGNFKRLKTMSNFNQSIIDQTSIVEPALLTIPTKLNNKTISYGYIGRFGKEKGIEDLLKFMDGSHRKLVIAGSGPLHKEVESHCKQNENFTNLGELSLEELHLFFNKIDVLIISSFEEAGPLVGIEAMAAGKLIVSTRVGAMPDRLKDVRNSFWFDIKKEQSFLDVLEKIEGMDRNTLHELKEENRKHYIKKYSFNVIASQYQEQIKNLIN